PGRAEGGGDRVERLRRFAPKDDDDVHIAAPRAIAPARKPAVEHHRFEVVAGALDDLGAEPVERLSDRRRNGGNGWPGGRAHGRTPWAATGGPKSNARPAIN